MSIAARMTRCPRPFDADRAADGRALFPGLSGAVADLIAGTAGTSPYLSGLLARCRDWLPEALDTPEAALRAELAALADAAPDALAPRLRQAKARVALLAALADLAGVWTLDEVTGALTDLADRSVDLGLRGLMALELGRGRIPGMTEADLPGAGGLVAMAMGKMGARELNYSSDIDLIVLFDETRHAREDYPEVRAAFIRITRRMAALLSDVTGDGYVFRTDLRLRPDAAVTPVCLSMNAAELYYESVGRTWERAAWIKARPAGGDLTAGAAFIDTLRPFVWRKHLDFAAIQDAHDMRLRIRDHKGLHGPLSLPGHDLKLGRGGIREIEFFTQTRQLIAGGRDPSLRLRGTVEGLAALAAAGWIPPDTAATLTDHYRAHRTVEHRIQMVNDAQTHAIPASDDGFARVACLMDLSPHDLRRDLTDRIEEVHDLTEGFFAPGLAAALPDDGFGADITARWPTYPALRSDRATEIFRRLKPEILRRLKDSARPDEALLSFDGFLSGLPAGVQLFSLFDANPQLTRLIVDIAATAPALARYLSRNAGVFDAVIGGRFFAQWPGPEGLAASLAEALAPFADYEKRLDAARRWMKEWHFRVGVHHLRGLIGADAAGAQYAAIADALVAGLWPDVVGQFAAKHGAPPGRGAVVVGMGSLGASRLNAGSDLDLIVIYDAAGAEASDGPRPLAARPYFARLTQALVTAITAPTAEGRLYEVDMRLRPSGRQGPVATSLDAFAGYQRTEAWTWEHLALTRARVVAGPADLSADVEALRRAVLTEKAGGPTVTADVADMRARIAAARAPDGPWDAKIGPGRLQDVELCAQSLALRAGAAARTVADQIAAGVAAGLLDAAEARALTDAARLFWQLQAAARLLTGGTLAPEALGEGGRRFVLRETGAVDMDDLQARIDSAARAAASVIDGLLA